VAPAPRQIIVEAWMMSGGGDAGPWIVLRNEFLGCCNADDIVKFGFDDGANPPTISGHPVEHNRWYRLKLMMNTKSGQWRGFVDGRLVDRGTVDKSKKINWVCLDAGMPGYFDGVVIRSEFRLHTFPSKDIGGSNMK
jgi:hypothetical protein